MKKDFHNFTVYNIPEENEVTKSPTTPFVIITCHPLKPQEKDKAYQIVSAIGKSKNQISFMHGSFDSLDHYDNTFKNQNVTSSIIFIDHPTEEISAMLYRIIPRAKTEVILANSIEQLIEDEKNDVKERRKSLWLAMKNWK